MSISRPTPAELADENWQGWLDTGRCTLTDADCRYLASGPGMQLPVYLAPYNQPMPAGRLPVHRRPSILRRLWSRVDRETRISLCFVAFALLFLLVVLADGHSRAAAIFS